MNTIIKKREEEFDMMKGIGILLVILGHIIPSEVLSIVRMPLFFFVSGLFFRIKPFSEIIKSSYKSLFIPYLKWSLLVTAVYFVLDPTKGLFYLKEILLGMYIPNDIGIAFGPLWFLLSIFWCRLLYNFFSIKLSKIWIIIIALLLTTIVYFLSEKIIYDPYFICTASYGLFFYSLGSYWKNNGNRLLLSVKYPLIYIIICAIICTIYQLYHPGLNWGLCNMTSFPFCLIGAYCFIYILYILCKLSLKKNYFFVSFFKWCGHNTMDILLIHTVEFHFLIGLISQFTLNQPTLIRVIIVGINVLVQFSIALLYAYMKNNIIPMMVQREKNK